MPTVEIDGRRVAVEDGTTVIRAAERLGIEIPHYCWHPGLSIAGNMLGTTICALSDAAAMPARAFVTKYRAEFEQHAALGRCPLRSEEPGRSGSFARAHAASFARAHAHG